jgi:foldase protein PrsA
MFLALTAVVAVGGTLAACGDSSLPGDAVAQVKDTTITKKQFEHWATIAAISQQAQTGATGAAPTLPVPPDFTACVAKARAALPKTLPKGQKPVTNAQLKAQCNTQYQALKDQVMQFLLSAEWISGESKSQGISVTDAEVQKEFNKQKAQSYPKAADFQKFLKSSGMTMEDLLYRVKIDTLSQKLRTKVTKGASIATPAAISAYYAKNKAKFGTPETRDIKIVLTKTEAQANAAKKALEAGQSWKAVVNKYSIDQASKAAGGSLPGVTKGQQEKSLDAAVFSAKKGVVLGPVKTQFGYYVFEVSAIKPAVTQSLVQATPQIKQLIQSQGQQKALDAFVKKFQKEWKSDTECRTGFTTAQCKNAPKPKTTATTAAPAPTATTQ